MKRKSRWTPLHLTISWKKANRLVLLFKEARTLIGSLASARDQKPKGESLVAVESLFQQLPEIQAAVYLQWKQKKAYLIKMKAAQLFPGDFRSCSTRRIASGTRRIA